MNLISTILISLVKAESNSIYVILGGTSASNSYPLVNQGNISNSFSYYFKNNTWLPANNPMPGGDGNGSSVWPSLGKSLQGNVYFYDCAKINANLPEWSDTGKYYNWAQTCFNLAGIFSKTKGINYNVLWQEGPQDNRYSYDSNYFLNTIQRLIYNSGLNNNWYISVYTYGGNYGYRYDKVQDIIYLINNNKNVYLGANIDSGCLTYQNLSIPILSNYWLQSIIESNRNVNIYNLCIGSYNFSNMLFILSIIFIGISLLFGAIYSCKYYQRRKYYQQLQN